jgi:hypothetical protein
LQGSSRCGNIHLCIKEFLFIINKFVFSTYISSSSDCVQDPSGSTYASISFRAILNQVVERVGVDYYGGEPFFTNNWKCQAILTLYKQAEESASALVRALAYFEGVLGWRIADINHVSYLQARVAHQ